jgi:serine/threonine protein kinase
MLWDLPHKFYNEKCFVMDRTTETELKESLAKRFVLESLVVSGRSADLYRAMQKGRNSGSVYIWVLRHTLVPSSNIVFRFNQRMQKLIELPILANYILDFGVDVDGVAYVVFSELSGKPLAPNHISIVESERSFQRCLALVWHVHQAGLVCGDITTSSFWSNNQGEISFIGVVGSFEVEAESTATAAPMETYHFMSPEQRSGMAAEQSSDVYSLGVLGYLLLTKSYPIGDNKKILLGPPDPNNVVPIRSVNRSAPPWSFLITERCLALDPNERFANAGEFFDAILQVRKGEYVATPLSRGSSFSRSKAVATKEEANNEPMLRNQNDELQHTVEGEVSDEVHSQNTHNNSDFSYPSREEDTPNRSKIPLLFMGGGIGLIVMALIIGISHFLRNYDHNEKNSGLPPKNLANPIDDFVSPVSKKRKKVILPRELAELLNKALNNENLSVVSDVIKTFAASDQDGVFDALVQIAKSYKLRNSELQGQAELAIVQKLGDRFGNLTNGFLSQSFKAGTFERCYNSLLDVLNFSDDPNSVDLGIKECFAVVPRDTLRLLAMILLDKPDEPAFKSVLSELTKSTNYGGDTDNFGSGALILTNPEIISILTQEQHQEILKKATKKELLALFRIHSQFSSETRIYYLLADSLVSKKIVPYPNGVLLEFLSDQSVRSARNVREALVRGIFNEITTEDVGVINQWASMRTPMALLAICAGSTSEDIVNTAFSLVGHKRIDLEPSRSLINWLKKSRWKRRNEYSKLFCDLGFFEKYSDDRKKEVIANLGNFMGETTIVKGILKVGSIELIRRMVLEHGGKLGLGFLTQLLSVPDNEVKIYAIRQLKSYNDLGVLKYVVENYRKEKDDTIREEYRKNFWVIQQQESEKKK